MVVAEALHPAEPSPDLAPDAGNGESDRRDDGDGLEPPLVGELRAGRRRVRISISPMASTMPPGTTLTVELAAQRRGVDLAVVVSAEAESVMVHATLDGRAMPVRRFMAPRRTEVELLAETVESVGPDPVAVAALFAAADLVPA